MFFGFTTGFYAAAVQCRVVLCIAYLVKVLIRFRFFVGVETCRRWGLLVRCSVAASVLPAITPAFVNLGAVKGWLTKPLVDRVVQITHPLGEVLTRPNFRRILRQAAHATILHGRRRRRTLYENRGNYIVIHRASAHRCAILI